MATAAELQRQIEEAQQALAEAQRQHSQAAREVSQAEERQRLRRRLDEINLALRNQQVSTSIWRGRRELIDRDLGGPCLPSENVAAAVQQHKRVPKKLHKDGEVDVTKHVEKGEFEWKLKGMSWLENALEQNGEEYVCTPVFWVGCTVFDLVYATRPTPIGENFVDGSKQVGSLALRHQQEGGIILRYKMFIKRAGGDYVQWGKEANECHPDDDDEISTKPFGPDVQLLPSTGAALRKPFGIFGLKHQELLSSEWIEDDTLTVKVQVEVMEEGITSTELGVKEAICVPPTDITAHLLSMLEDGRSTDITFVVGDQKFTAHSQIVSARSEVFYRELNSGMQESISKVIEVRDVEAAIFNIFLRFLYNDDLQYTDALIKSRVAELKVDAGAGSSVGASDMDEMGQGHLESARANILKNLLSASHRYQVERLRVWCEQQLCEYICKELVCSLLCHAHLYEAKKLEKACLAYIKKNQDQVVATADFGRMSAEWPELMLKLNICLSGLSEGAASSAVEAHQGVRKKRALQQGVLEEIQPVATKRKRDE